LLLRDVSNGEAAEQTRDLHRQADENARLALSLVKNTGEAAPAGAPPPGNDIPVFSTEAQRATGRNFLWVSIAIFFSKVLGFFREIVIASVLGTDRIADMFGVIFGLPNLLFTGIGNALSAVNIPDLTKFLREDDTSGRKAYVTNLFTQLTLFCGLLSLAGVVLAPFVVRMYAPDLEPRVMGIAITLSMIMIPCLLFVNLAYFSMGILQAHGFFLLSSVISIPFNILIIVSIFIFGGDVLVIGYMTTAGWFLQFFIQYPRLRRMGYRMLGRISLASPQARNLYRNLLPILLGYSVLQICLLVDRTFFGIRLDEGSAAALNYGSNLFITITSVFVVAMSFVIFPRLSKYCQERDAARLRELIGTVFQMLFFILLPYILLVAFFNREIIAVVYERGSFDAASTSKTATAFLFYSFAAIGYACQEIFNRVFYAFKRYRVPMYTSLLCIGLNIVLNFVLFRPFGIAGISLSTAFCLFLYAAVLYGFLRREIGGGMGLSLLFGFARVLPSLLVMLAVILTGRWLGGDSLAMVIGTAGAGGAAYLAVAFLTGAGKIFAR
jgi:putative peptidoglycan lipid II flippase